ncbi:MAG TPA: proton-conducting transporter membrane subunit [Candidatus Dormibacteraeota bacterium]|nr:proton-conducting transporter membrane subunit [Candidatus Dormibacteraeota bacterium]
MRYLILVPEALLVAGAAVILLAGRFGWFSPAARRSLPAIASGIALVAFVVELWAGSTLTTFFGGALVQDRFALFTKAAILLAALLAIAAADWAAEDSGSIGPALTLLAAFGVMVAASAADLVALWAGLELAAAAAVAVLALRRPDLALRLIVTGAVASGLLLVGFAFLYATAGNPDLRTIHDVMLGASPSVGLAIPVVLLLSGLAVRAGLAPFQLASVQAGVGASPLGAGLLLGVVAAAAATVTIKLAAALVPAPADISPYLGVLAAVAMVGGGAAALAARSPRARMAYLAVGQVGWIAAGLSTHFTAGIAGSLFLLGAFVVAATCGPAVLGRAEGGEAAIAGLAAVRPVRAIGLALAMLSLAGAPPLAGFFGELVIGAALAQSGNLVLLALGILGSLLSLAGVISTLRVIYVLSPLEEARRGAAAALPVVTALSTAGVIAFSVVVTIYGFMGYPIMGLANQGAEALGLR